MTFGDQRSIRNQASLLVDLFIVKAVEEVRDRENSLVCRLIRYMVASLYSLYFPVCGSARIGDQMQQRNRDNSVPVPAQAIISYHRYTSIFE
jgi:hypothetical protein